MQESRTPSTSAHGGRWIRDVYRDAVWESEDLNATEKAVAETYARHARDKDDNKSATADLAWLTYPRLMTKAGIGRRANVSAAIAALVEAGWLTVVRETSRRPTLYRLTIPAGSSDGGTSDRSSDGGTTVVPKIASGSSASVAGSSDGGTQPLGPSVKPPSTSLSARTSVPAPRDSADEDRERDVSTSSEDQNLTPQQRMVIEAGCPQHLAAEVVDFIEGKHNVQHFGWWRKVEKSGDLPALVQEALNATPTCSRCGNTGKVWLEEFGDMVACGSCPSRAVQLDQQPRTSQRGQFAPHESTEARKARGWLSLQGRPRQLHNSHENQDRFDEKL